MTEQENRQVSAHEQYLSQKRFGSLDGLRALSILAVIWHHTAPSWAGARLAHFGAHGVTLFFAISGFLITTLLVRERARNATIDLKAFYLRRTFRIFPLYYGVLLLYIVAVFFFERTPAVAQGFWDNLKYFATFTSNIFVPLDGRVVFYFAWSVAAEEQFYLLWPTLLLLTATTRRALVLLSVAFATCVAAQLLGSQALTMVPLAMVGGALLALSLHTPKGFHAIEKVLGHPGITVAIVLSLALALSTEASPNFIVHTLFVALVGACILRENHPVAPFLTLAPLAYMGSISYGMYMLHMLCKNATVKVLVALKMPTDGLEVFALTLLLSVAVATVSFRYYESVFVGMKRRWER
jgi:peptidoglycan/LPS O-acetylase OafA/YrhL